jgi:hypothetical protein
MQRLKVYLELQKLKNLWDSKFDKQEFEVGTKHVGNCLKFLTFICLILTNFQITISLLKALCAVTRIIKDNAFENLRGLLTIRERKKLAEDVSTKWTQAEK